MPHPRLQARNSSRLSASTLKSSSCCRAFHISSSTRVEVQRAADGRVFHQPGCPFHEDDVPLGRGLDAGRWTFTTTRFPSVSRASCTWAMEAEPSGSGSMTEKISSHGLPQRSDDMAHGVGRHGCHVGAQTFKRGAVFLGQNIGAHGEDLAKLYEGGAQILKNCAQLFRRQPLGELMLSQYGQNFPETFSVLTFLR
jgi:hypothetical protein